MSMNISIPKKPYKVVIIGDSNVGKTCIIERFINNSFDITKPTIGAMHYEKKINDVNLDIWDTAGQERFRSMIPMYYKGTKSIIVVYDITDSATFEGAKKWINEISQNVSNASIVLVGNKCDLDDKRKITKEMGQLFAKENGYDFLETSAKDNININALFEVVSQKVSLIKQKEKEDLSKVTLNTNNQNKPQEGGWCC